MKKKLQTLVVWGSKKVLFLMAQFNYTIRKLIGPLLAYLTRIASDDDQREPPLARLDWLPFSPTPQIEISQNFSLPTITDRFVHECLSIKRYDDACVKAQEQLSWPQIVAFSPAHFLKLNFPTTATDEMELRKYVDIMAEGEMFQSDKQIGTYSTDEAAEMIRVSESIKLLSAHLFNGVPVQPFVGLFRHFFDIFRIICCIRNRYINGIKILEIGPGSGMLGAYLLGLPDLSYYYMENCQAFYLWQHRLFKYLSSNDFEDCAMSDDIHDKCPKNRVIAIPWWHFANFYRRTPFNVDVVICDAALGEMDVQALDYVIRLSKKLLENSPIGLFLYTQVGAKTFSTDAYVQDRFSRAGYGFEQVGRVAIRTANQLSDLSWAPSDRSTAPYYNPSKQSTTLRPWDFLPFDKAHISDSYRFFEFTHF